MSAAGANEQDVLSVARTLDFSQAETGQQDGMNGDQAADVSNGETGTSETVHHDGEADNRSALQNPEETGEEKGEEKHVISHGAEKGEHQNVSTLGEDEFQKLLLLAEEFEADDKAGDDGEETGNKGGSEESKVESGIKDDQDGKGLSLKVKPGPAKTLRTGAATATRKGPTPVARVSKARPSTGPSAGKNDKIEIDGTPKRKRLGEEGAIESESRSLPTTPSVNRSTTNGARKLTVPQPFALATDKRASLGGRPTDGDLASRLALPSVKKAPAPAKLTSKLTLTKPSEGPKRYEQSTGKVKNVTSSSEDDSRSGSNPYPALKIKSNQPPVTSASSFQFKCDERAEKRREFYNKLEERLSAKEAEKTQIEAKTQEEIEAKIKELRKSLTFKANPMPSFYQEAPPPKVEIKKIPTTRAKSPKLGTSRRSSGVGTMAEDSRSCRTSRIDLEHKLNGLSDDGQNKEKKVVKKPSGLTKALSDKTMKSAKSNGRLEGSKTQATSASGAGDADGKPKENKVVSDSAGASDESKTNSAGAAQDTSKDDAAPVGDSVAADGSNSLNEKDGSGGTSEKASRPSNGASIASSEEAKDKVVKTTKQKLKASTPTLSSAAKRETSIKHSSKNGTEIAHSVADVVVAS
ncbi:hypothetical protein R1flu_023028 [Riccia fluitans]|uniref:TPX2 C-terminal domain-containing protein n=1 Tax=Riccia fluitans TaxID=41844 RepID=A0ABD1XTW5_9MARC